MQTQAAIDQLLDLSEASDALEAIFWPLRYFKFTQCALNNEKNCHRCLNHGSQNRKSGSRAY